jgi:hypothetical protein
MPKLKKRYKNPNAAANVTKMQPNVIIGWVVLKKSKK